MYIALSRCSVHFDDTRIINLAMLLKVLGADAAVHLGVAQALLGFFGKQ